MNTPIRWGILGTGNIAGQFARGLRRARDAKLVAVGSRSVTKARRFGREFGAAHFHASYESLAADDTVDVVYVATPHPMHLDNTLLCLRAGKAVLCEKPFALNEAEARQAVAVARRKKLFLMEALWTSFLPPIVRLRQLLDRGELGEVRLVAADFGFRAEWDPCGRLFDPRLGGGCLLDIGIYTIWLATMVLGAPAEVIGLAHIGPTGVDEQVAVALKYPGGALAALSATIRAATPNEATIIGADGHLRLLPHWWMGSPMTLTARGRARRIDAPVEGKGYHYEAEEVVRCLRKGKLESDIMPLQETLSVLRTMDRLRASWGLRYPMEKRR